MTISQTYSQVDIPVLNNSQKFKTLKYLTVILIKTNKSLKTIKLVISIKYLSAWIKTNKLLIQRHNLSSTRTPKTI